MFTPRPLYSRYVRNREAGGPQGLSASAINILTKYDHSAAAANRSNIQNRNNADRNPAVPDPWH